jgi:predicted enzyme related to lactoylglutathione lyase
MMKRQKPQQPNINYIDVKLVDEYVEKIGGKAVVPKKAVPGMGTSVCLDTENNAFAIWESNESAK